MQLRDVDLRSIGHSSQKLWPKTFFGKKCLVFCLINYKAKYKAYNIMLKKIRNTISRLVRDLVQKAKWSKIFRRKRIQALPTISNNLWQSDWVYSRASEKLTCHVLKYHLVLQLPPVGGRSAWQESCIFQKLSWSHDITLLSSQSLKSTLLSLLLLVAGLLGRRAFFVRSDAASDENVQQM